MRRSGSTLEGKGFRILALGRKDYLIAEIEKPLRVTLKVGEKLSQGGFGRRGVKVVMRLSMNS